MGSPQYRPPYENLIVLEDIEFPRRCSCSRYFANLEQFIEDTKPVANGSGLSELPWHDETQVGIWRNCDCGSTLLVLCSNRRNTSMNGKSQRLSFEAKLIVLQSQGFSLEGARAQLLTNIASQDRSHIQRD